MLIRQRITILNIRKPRRTSLNEELQWFGNSLGLFHLRDKDSSCFRLFIELLKAAKQDKSLTSDELAEKIQLSRGTVVHHINKLIESGIILHEGNRYILRDAHLESLIDDLRRDFERAIEELRTSAKEIDQFLEM